jgi:hypothetical protein
VSTVEIEDRASGGAGAEISVHNELRFSIFTEIRERLFLPGVVLLGERN